MMKDHLSIINKLFNKIKYIMKKQLTFFFIILFSLNVKAQTDIQKAEAILKQMTLEEKVGQMTQVTFAVIAKGGWADTEGNIDEAALKKAIDTYHVGSILNVNAHAFSVDKWNQVIKQIQDEANKTRLKIPIIYGLDGMHGQTYTLNSTLFPQNIGIAASRNPQLAIDGAKTTAMELRASGVRWNFAPVLDIGRQPLWSRFAETYGEDVFIGKTMGAAAIKAYEEDGLKNITAVASCMKHYLGYSNPRNGKDRSPTYMPEIEMREFYLPQFREAVKAGSSTIMINSGEINGIPVHADKYLLTDVLRKELGFQGVIVSDWEDIIRLHNRHNVAATPRQAVVMAVNAGIDMSIVNGELNNVEAMKSLSRFIELKELESVRFATLKNLIEIKNQIVNIPKMEVKSTAYRWFGR